MTTTTTVFTGKYAHNLRTVLECRNHFLFYNFIIEEL